MRARRSSSTRFLTSLESTCSFRCFRPWLRSPSACRWARGLPTERSADMRCQQKARSASTRARPHTPVSGHKIATDWFKKPGNSNLTLSFFFSVTLGRDSHLKSTEERTSRRRGRRRRVDKHVIAVVPAALTENKRAQRCSLCSTLVLCARACLRRKDR